MKKGECCGRDNIALGAGLFSMLVQSGEVVNRCL